jgi:signal transduction histidine kinase/AraC-like DNA-binding protein
MGLTIINPEDMSARKYTESTGFPDNTVYAITQDVNDNIWLSTNQGLYKSDLKFTKFTNYTVNDGLPTNRFNYKAVAKIGSKLYFGSTEGLVIVDPEMEKSDNKIYNIWLDNFYIHGEKQEIGHSNLIDKDLNDIEEIHLNYKQTSWSVDFTCNVFDLHNRPRFAYKFLGLDDQWMVLDTKHRLDFAGLSYGHYKLSICTIDDDGKPQDNQRILNVYISPLWWQSTLAKILFAFVIIGIILYLFYLYSNNQKNKHALALEKVERKKDTEINELKLRFFVNISHEFKTPLSLILGPVNQFMENRVKGSKQLHYYNIIKKNADKLLNLINELLAFRELEHLKLKVEPINYQEFINSVLSKHILMFESKGIQFDIVDSGKETVIHADADKLEKIFDNLLSNACKYTNKQGQVSVEIKTNDDKVVTVVTNTGAGIDKDKLPFIFDRFFTNDSYDKYSSGVGLSYVQSLIEAHGGIVSADSVLGEYTSILFSIPLRKEILQTKPRTIADYNLDIFSDNQALTNVNDNIPDLQFEDATRNTQVLIVDDDNDLREIIADYLSDSFIVSTVASGEGALELIRRQSVDIVISDVKMGGMSGYELCQTLKGDINTSHIRVILMTVLSETSYRYSGYKSGADAYITKPFELSLLELRIKNLLYNSYEAKQKYRVDIDLSNVEVTHSDSDEELLNKAVNIVFKNLSDPEFDVEKFCSELGMSKASLYRKLRATTGQSINEFIQNIRLKYAARILIETDKTISEIAYEVGFSDPYYFSRAFKKCFSQSPQHWRESNLYQNSS